MERSSQEWKAIADSVADTKANLSAQKTPELVASAQKAREEEIKLQSALEADNPFFGMEGYEPMNKADVKPSPSGEDAVLAFEARQTKEAIVAARERALAAADTNPGVARPEVVDLTDEVQIDEEEGGSDLPREQTYIGPAPTRPEKPGQQQNVG